MMKGVRLYAAMLIGSFAAAAAQAHHSVAGQFDLQKTVRLVGVVSEVEWINPHIYIHFSVPNEDGSTTTWMLETVPTAMTRKAGLTKSMLRGNGETLTIDVHPARDGTPNLGYIIKITFPDGRFFQFKENNTVAATGS
ncbi:MAG: DUF6152 family protein [Pseudomonadota bacterium]|jgi:hypothetical protein|nr:MAG: hypothetical protein DIU56_06790 [Pseudomonadota bacterium]